MSIAPRHIQLLDVTLRDGEQTRGVSFSRSEKESIAKALLGSLRVDRIEIASAGISEGEREAVERIMGWAGEQGMVQRVEVLGFVDHKRSADWIVAAGGRVMNLLTKGSEKHCSQQLRQTLAEHLHGIEQTVAYAKQRGLNVNVYLEDWSNGYKDSRDYVYAMMDGICELAIDHYMLPDTLGVMTPDEVETSLGDMIGRYPRCNFDFHPHNDYGLATANCMAAVKAGVSSIHCTVNCLGERAGNVSMAEVAVVLKDKMGMHLGIDESEIYALSQMVENFSGKQVADNAPIIGADVFTQTSGIHADGDYKGGLYQTDLSPGRFDRTHSYALGKMSGKASLQKNLDELKISLSDEDRAKVLKRIVELGDSKAEITIEDLPFVIADILESKDYTHIELLNCSITSGLNLESTISIRVQVQGEIYKSHGAGNGGFDAFIAAIKKVMEKGDIDFEFPELLDFQIRIPKSGSSSALTECIIIWRDGPRTITTRGVNANQVFAGINATLKMLNMQLHQQTGVASTPAEAAG